MVVLKKPGALGRNRSWFNSIGSWVSTPAVFSALGAAHSGAAVMRVSLGWKDNPLRCGLPYLMCFVFLEEELKET